MYHTQSKEKMGIGKESTRYEIHYFYKVRGAPTRDVILCWCDSMQKAKLKIITDKKKNKFAEEYRVYDTLKLIPKNERLEGSRFVCVYSERK